MAEGPVSPGQWFADFLKMLLLLAAIGLLFAMLTTGLDFLRAVAIEGFGRRPVGTAEVVLKLAFFVIAAPLAFLAIILAVVATFWTYRSWRWFVAHLVLAVLPIAAVTGYVVWFHVGPWLLARQHVTNWPADLELIDFEVCAIEVSEEALRVTAPVGRVAFAVVNRSPVSLDDAGFSVNAGSNWFQFTIQNLGAGETRHVEREVDLGTIEAELSGNFTGRALRPANLFWDSVRYATSVPRNLVNRPDIAEIGPIPDCPRLDLAGVWTGADGTEIHLTQRGDRPRGFVRGGSLSDFPNPIAGVIRGRTFSGGFDHRAARSLSSGTFSLTLTESGRLEGSWSLPGGSMTVNTGTWVLARSPE